MTGTETHHLLSPKLCEHGGQCVSAQRGSRAAAAAADPHQGETGGHIHAWKCVCLTSAEIYCTVIVVYVKHTAPSRGSGEPRTPDEGPEGEFERNLPQLQ